MTSGGRGRDSPHLYDPKERVLDEGLYSFIWVLIKTRKRLGFDKSKTHTHGWTGVIFCLHRTHFTSKDLRETVSSPVVGVRSDTHQDRLSVKYGVDPKNGLSFTHIYTSRPKGGDCQTFSKWIELNRMKEDFKEGRTRKRVLFGPLPSGSRQRPGRKGLFFRLEEKWVWSLDISVGPQGPTGTWVSTGVSGSLYLLLILLRQVPTATPDMEEQAESRQTIT